MRSPTPTAAFDRSAARFARDHASWTTPGISFEELLVSRPTRCPKGGYRTPEQSALHRIGADAPRRLTFQAGYPID
ncbi:hypothetical protein BN6_46740 [Saccharothrix espanaensis DSM 44229]|uniref:Uncharacterized protein n=1 Tax=Saccharothrix espanaensis (strain ATCC 51144 / DSM 44229 / JCM 9112 / NBRC 15066 / NRRL 15764) TaxID=1179773 RepID=K0K5W7_SACES|nr:hypothetical protein BN6_46740 [Saccharothrix espanaensis DSM 44229]